MKSRVYIKPKYISDAKSRIQGKTCIERRASKPIEAIYFGKLLMENNGYLLLESGNRIRLE